jgi:hypothetical protein
VERRSTNSSTMPKSSPSSQRGTVDGSSHVCVEGSRAAWQDRGTGKRNTSVKGFTSSWSCFLLHPVNDEDEDERETGFAGRFSLPG